MQSIPLPLSTALKEASKHNPGLLVFNHGIEREALRVTHEGHLATTPHPGFLGGKLTHPKVTTDFSESQLELITPVHQSPAAALAELDEVHRYIYSGLQEEKLWSASMPCLLRADGDIPLAYYGESNLGRLKKAYRSGLGYRYGRGMQTICAVHYNFSFPDSFLEWLRTAEQSTETIAEFRNRRYFDLMRNFRRYSWLLTYLFGASPAVCNSFLKGKQHSLLPFDGATAFLPNATSLRSGNLGYQSNTQAENLNICYNGLENYVATLANAIATEHAPYKDIGLLVNREYRQINTNILQSEAEFYSSIRAKRVPDKGENFLACLLERGVQYIEVRLLDVNPYLPLGIDEQQIKFLDSFLLFCLLSESPGHDDQLCREVTENSAATVYEGRDNELVLSDQGRKVSLREWGSALLTNIAESAALLDTGTASSYQESVTVQLDRLQNSTLTPSGSILHDMETDQISFSRFAMEKTLEHERYFKSQPFTPALKDKYEVLAKKSIEDQAAIEVSDTLTFDEYLLKIAEEYKPLAVGS
ncbi:MAG: glutamate--cysteine ligase [Gammaproteobacteria bacterium]|nr:glutamate--cysteine ligase [Gammaproteobacteria bacterium]